MKTAFKKKQEVCSVVFVLAMLALIGVNCDYDIMIFIIKNLLCIAAMIASAVVGRLTDIEVESEDK